jgi:hypothetical protein
VQPRTVKSALLQTIRSAHYVAQFIGASVATTPAANQILVNTLVPPNEIGTRTIGQQYPDLPLIIVAKTLYFSALGPALFSVALPSNRLVWLVTFRPICKESLTPCCTLGPHYFSAAHFESGMTF